jgi:16S rRNA A1518/A1519 N6-dimethyltransferase RsmA/KsgA/DIM1 with predicted DNA glycosylase/AP lyase activity
MGFASRRKQLKNTLAAGLRLDPSDVVPVLVEIGVAPEARPQELGVRDWVSLARVVEKRLTINK